MSVKTKKLVIRYNFLDFMFLFSFIKVIYKKIIINTNKLFA